MKSQPLEAQLLAVKKQALSELSHYDSLEELEHWNLTYLGRKSQLSQFSQQLKDLPAEEKASAGRALNETKKSLIEAYSNLESTLKDRQSAIDLSIPASQIITGHIHPISQTIDEIVTIFSHLGMNF